jgi:hypothetical protein
MQPIMPGFPLPLRNALAELALAAHHDDAARAALGWLAAPGRPPAPDVAATLARVHLVDPDADELLAVHAPHADAVRAHANRARRAATAFRATAPPGALAREVARAAALWDERLFFEVHEVLEAVWHGATGPVRQALQGAIQVAVAFHHLSHGNLRGARSLLGEGRGRLASVPPDVLPGVDVPALLAATEPWLAALARREAPAEPPPRLPRRTPSG